MSEDREERPGRFSGFLGGVRLIFDGMLLLMVLLAIGFIGSAAVQKLGPLPFNAHPACSLLARP